MELFSTQREFSAYGPSYWAVIAVFAIGAALLGWIGRRQTESQARRLGHILGVLTAAIYGAGLIYSLIPPSIDRSVPLNLTLSRPSLRPTPCGRGDTGPLPSPTTGAWF